MRVIRNELTWSRTIFVLMLAMLSTLIAFDRGTASEVQTSIDSTSQPEELDGLRRDSREFGTDVSETENSLAFSKLYWGARWFLTGICVSLLFILFLVLLTGNPSDKADGMDVPVQNASDGRTGTQPSLQFPCFPVIPIAFSPANGQWQFGQALPGSVASGSEIGTGTVDGSPSARGEDITEAMGVMSQSDCDGYGGANSRSSGKRTAKSYTESNAKHRSSVVLTSNPFGVDLEVADPGDPVANQSNSQHEGHDQSIVRQILRENMGLKRFR